MRKGHAQNVDDDTCWPAGKELPGAMTPLRQNGLTTTKMTIPIMRIVGTSLIMR
jgi:hypothetical protein